MRILCAPVNLHPETKKCLDRDAPDAEIVWIKRGDKFDYWKAISERWTGEDDLLIIEQDMEWEPGDIESIRRCPERWCSFKYKTVVIVGDGLQQTIAHWCLGFTKFSALLQQQYPVETIQKTIDACGEKCGGVWFHLDAHIATTLKGQHCLCCTKMPHVHGTVQHHHSYKWQEPVDPDIIEKLDRARLVEYLEDNGWTQADKVVLHD